MSGTALLAIVGMGIATSLPRLSGFYLLRGLNVTGPMKAALDALPPAVLMAVIAPTAFATGWAETLACAAAVIAASRLPMLASVVIGVATVALLRAAGL